MNTDPDKRKIRGVGDKREAFPFAVSDTKKGDAMNLPQFNGHF
jgi:hypothetical protein